jgi:small-conductance mechanosensitive channel
VLAFWSGGFFDRPRLIALIVTWALVGAGAALTPRPLPGGAGLVAIVALAALAGWIALSSGWAPLGERVQAELERALLYLGGLVAVAMLFRARPAARAVEPALAAGALVMISYGLSGRLLPSLIHLHESVSAGGRLEQPLTYWNATGALAAMGFVLCARLSGDLTRTAALRVVAAASAVPLGLGAYLSFSRGALGALVIGLAVLLRLCPGWAQVRGVMLVLEGAVVTTLVCAHLPGVASLAGDAASRQSDGTTALLVLVVVMLLVAVVQARACRDEHRGRLRVDGLALPRPAARLATVAIVTLVIAPIALTGADRSPQTAAPAFGAAPSRLATVGSNRYAYWRVAVSTLAEHPLRGAGAGSFAAQWLRQRTIDETVRDAHSLELQTAAELGLVGLGLLVLALGAVASCARRAWRRDAALACGPCAALAAWAVHSAIDWDWQMPALTLVAVVLAGTLLAAAGAPGRSHFRAELDLSMP